MKKLSAILICLLMVITCGIAGCAGVYIDKVKYYNEVLAKVGNTNITRYEVLSAYRSYGQDYYSAGNSGISSTLDNLINQEALYQYALDQEDLYKPTAYQVNSAIQDLFDSLDEQMETYTKQSKSVLNIKTEETTEDENSDETAYLRNDYTYSKRVKVVEEDGKFVLKYDVEEDPEVPKDYERLIDLTYLQDFTNKNTISAIQDAYLEHLLDNLKQTEKSNADKIYDKNISLFAKDLINYEYYLRDENGKQYSNVTSELIYRYIERSFKSQIKSKYLTNIRINYLQNEDLSIDKLVESYSYLKDLNILKYENDLELYMKDIAAVGTKGDKFLYHPTTDSQFGYFIHTLINFGDLQNEIKALESEKDQDKYDAAYQDILSRVVVNPRDTETGLVDKSIELHLTDVFEEYENIKAETDYDKKLNMFIDFMFKYTGDDKSTLVSGMPYVVGTNGHSAMETNFTNEAIKLMSTGVPGTISNASIDDIDSWCITSYGIHFLFYVEDVAAYDLDEANFPGDTSVAKYFESKILNPLTGETYLDKLFDAVYPASSNEVYTSNTGYSKFENAKIEESKKAHGFEKFETKIKATKTSL